MPIPSTLTRSIKELSSTLAKSSVWLTDDELQQCDQFRNPGRRQEWMAGRWVLKELLQQAWPDSTKLDWSIQSRDRDGKPLAPIVFRNGIGHPVRVSISHTNDWVMAALTQPPWRLGCDLTPMDVNLALAKYWFTDNEREWQRQLRSPDSTSLIWGLKEAFYKALGDNSPFRPAEWDVTQLLRRCQLELPPLPMTRNRFEVHSESATLQFFRCHHCIAIIVTVAEHCHATNLPHALPFDLLHEITT